MSAAVDVVIPVYNSPELTRRCVESIYARIAHRVGDVFVHDNASDAPTRDMLDSLSGSGLHVHHAPTNTGFGDAVNQGVARTKTPLVLVLNSDVDARNDFMGPLLDVMDAEKRLAAVTPSGNTYRRYDWSRYAQRAGCVVTYHLGAYGFLLRREAFDEAGGFDPAFGLGFYEDLDLSRRLVKAGWWMGIHAKTDLHHEIHGSFRELPDFREILGENRTRYFDRYPEATRQVLLISAESDHESLPEGLRRELGRVLAGGGEASWATRRRAQNLHALQMYAAARGWLGTARLLWTAGRRRKPFSEVWIAADVPDRVARLLGSLARRSGLSVQRF
jgi:GT2 family glycosyltransferase